MGRIKLELPEQALGVFQVPVRISDINYGNHVGNDAFVSIIHEARLQWLQANGCTELNVGGAGLILSDLAVQFRQEAFYGDVIEVTLFAGEMSRVSFELYYSLAANRSEGKVSLAQAKTTMICYNYNEKKTVSLTELLKTMLQQG